MRVQNDELDKVGQKELPRLKLVLERTADLSLSLYPKSLLDTTIHTPSGDDNATAEAERSSLFS